MTIRTVDLIETYKAMTIVFSILDELKLTDAQHARKLDAIKGKVAIQCMMYEINQKVEVTE
jgi:hypothetical protein